MHEILDEIERAAERCQKAASAFQAPGIMSALDPFAPGEAVKAAIDEAARALDDVRRNIVPQMDALAGPDHDDGITSKFEAVRQLVSSEARQEIRATLCEIDARFPALDEGNLFSAIDPITGFLGGVCIGMGTLPDLAQHLAYIARYFRAKQAIGPRTDTVSPVSTNVYHHGDVIMGDKYKTTITGSTVGAFAQGDHAVATGHVTIGASGSLTQEQHKTAISAAQTALVHDQDALERIDDRLYEALGQFLTLARKIQVEQQSLAEVQAQMKATLDEVWAQQEAKGMKPKLLPKGLEVVEALAKSPITAEIAKKLLGA